MSLINPTLLLALPLAIIPVLLHLLLRSKPKRMAFPALRLIQSRSKSNSRRFRLKQFWLMLLRVIVIAFFILLLTRPSLPAANYTPNLYETLMTIGLVVAAIVTCWGLKRLWEQRQLPRHQIAYRQTLSRSIAGLAAGLLFLLLVAWPYAHRLRAELTSPRPIVSESVPSAAVLLFDVSLSMEYRAESDTRLDVARDIASRHLDQMPNGSRVAIATNQDQSPILFHIDKTTARETMFDIELTPSPTKLNTRLWDALSFQEQDRERIGNEQSESSGEIVDRFVREIYLFTDLSRNAWDLAEQQYLKGELERLDYVQLYIIDVSKDEPQNISLSNARLARQEFLRNEPINISVTLEADRQTGLERQVELYTENRTGEMIRRAVETVELNAGKPETVNLSFLPEDAAFGANGSDESTDWSQSLQGEIRLNSTDAMTFDNQRFFTVNRRLPPRVLIVQGSTNGAQILQEYLAPTSWRQDQSAPFRVELVRQEAVLAMSADELKAYDNVCLVSIASPREELWQKLEGYVSGGGGLFVVVGNTKIDPIAYSTDAAMSVLPARLKAFIRLPSPESIDFESGKNHPLLKPFQDLGGFGDLPDALVNWCWSVEPHPAANVITRYTTSLGYPAIVDRILGRGHSLMLTTSIDRSPLDVNWSTLSRTSWFIVLADKLMEYTGGGNSISRNYLAGEAIVLPLSGERKSASYLLRQPNLKQVPIQPDPENEMLLIRNAESLGHYQVIPKETPDSPFFQYSLNVDDNESDLEPITTDELDSLLGEERYQVSRSTDELTRQVGIGRIGQEMFPIVLGLLFAFFWGEHFIANRFYDHEQTPVV